MPRRAAASATTSRSRYSPSKRSASARPMPLPPAPNWRESVMTGIPVPTCGSGRRGRSEPGERVNELAHGVGGALEGRLFVVGQVDRNDLDDAATAELD